MTNESDFETLLQNNNDVCNHHKNIQIHLSKSLKLKKVLPHRSWDLSLKREIIVTM